MRAIFQFLFFSGVLFLWVNPSAWAARGARVDVDEVKVYSGASPDSGVVKYLRKGDPVAASNSPIRGFYKIRTQDGTIGFVQADTLMIYDPGANPKVNRQVASAPDDELLEEVLSSPKNKGKPGEFQRLKTGMKFRLLGGYNLFKSTDMNTLIGLDVVNGGLSIGGEAHFLLSPRFSMVTRVEWLYKSVVAQDNASTETFEFTVSSIPVTVGVQLDIFESQRWVMSGAVLGGLAVATRLNSTALDRSSPNETIFNSFSFTGLAKLEVAWHWTPLVHFFFETGYRYLRTPDITPSTTGNGSVLFTSGGSYVPVPLDLSGFSFALGVGLSF